jgi:cytochrome c oxidase assembly protein subunit 15
MPTAQAFRVAHRLATSTALLLFGLIVLGSIVRTTGSGLACPDWPLCHGRLIPPLQFNVLIEWFHRLVALLVSLLMFATVAWTLVHREVRARLAGLALLGTALLLVQVLLGALTVWKLLHPSVVSSHLAVALLLFSTWVTVALVARGEGAADAPAPARPPGLLAVCSLALAFTYGQIVLGGVVSTSHAGLACPDWPTCHGEWFPALEGLVGLQMAHRFAAYALTGWVLFTWWRTRSAPDPTVRVLGRWTLGLTFGQVAIGAANVLLGTPVWMSALHLANATAMLGTLLLATYRVAAMPAAVATLRTAVAR